ncbi:iron-containing redox enzyme family protein [Pollutimonas nitritireducens]|nr:iron-containing redox enzyme family protein [Pollutimonas nitritireducens]
MVLTEEGLMDRLRNNDARTPYEQHVAKGALASTGRVADGRTPHFDAKQIYFGLMGARPDDLAVARSRLYLTQLLAEAIACDADLPDRPEKLQAWSIAHTEKVGTQYRQYLKARRAGDTRQYFTNKSHALYFLKGVAPTKLVDGAWLYGLLQHWRDPRFLPLIQTYLEELGEGAADKNHVVLYKKLLGTHGCLQWHSLSDAHFIQGAIQLALAQHTAHFLPEVIGYNLGYEQLPLHLLISAYELNELGIDPYYFTLHVTVDNASTGHAMQAVQAVFDALPQVADKKEFYRRVVNGYKLNELGASTNSVIASFDLDEELVAVLTAKAGVGAQLHSDYCKIAGKTVNEWLAVPAQIPMFLASLEENGWIKRHQNPENSRFWKLIQGEQAHMFGVFNAYEKQVIHDWIAGDSAGGTGSRPISFRARQRLATQDSPATMHYRNSALRSDCSIPKAWCDSDATMPSHSDIDADLHQLEQRLANAPGKDGAMTLLIPLLSPVHHHTAPGLMATRLYTRLLHDA